MGKDKVLIVGGGPIGLYLAGRLQEKSVSYHLFEAEDVLGGQLTSLYPAKEVVDIPFLTPRNAQDVVKWLLNKIDWKNVSLSTPILDVKEEKDGVLLKTSQGDFRGSIAVIATGLGFHKPRPLGIADEEKCSNILYSLLEPTLLQGKKIAIFGGGDSALDWAKALSKISDEVSLIHRRTEFRGNPDTIKGCKLRLYLPYVPDHLIEKKGLCQEIVIKNVNDGSFVSLPVDVVLVNYGQIPSPSTFSYPLSKTGFGIEVGLHNRISPHVFAIGDCAYSQDKKKRIAPGMMEANEVLATLGF